MAANGLDRKLIRGLMWGLFSGAMFGLDGVLVGIALLMRPFSDNPSMLAAPIAAAAIHDGVGAVMFAAHSAITGKTGKLIEAVKTRAGWIICVSAVLGGPVGMVCYVVGIMRAGAVYTLPVAATYPLAGTFFAAVFLKEKIGARSWIGIAVGVAGAAVVGAAPAAGAHHGQFHSGVAFAAMASAAWGVEGVLASWGMERLEIPVAIALRQISSFAAYGMILFPVSFAFPVFVSALKSPVMGIMTAVGVCGALSLMAWFRSINLAGVGRAMSMNLTFAVWGVVFGAMFAGSKVTAPVVLGAVMVVCGALVVASPGKKAIGR